MTFVPDLGNPVLAASPKTSQCSSSYGTLIHFVLWTIQSLTNSQTKFADLVQIAPHDFSKHSIDAIEDNINAKYANRVSKPSNLSVIPQY